jgi:hypothetical protein
MIPEFREMVNAVIQREASESVTCETEPPVLSRRQDVRAREVARLPDVRQGWPRLMTDLR